MKTSTEVMNSPGASSKIPVDGISLGGKQAARTEKGTASKDGIGLHADNTEGGCVLIKRIYTQIVYKKLVCFYLAVYIHYMVTSFRAPLQRHRPTPSGIGDY